MASKRHPATDEEPAPELEAAPHEHVPERNGMRLAKLTIPAGQAVSDAAEVTGASVEFIVMPDAWTPSSITFLASFDGENFYDLFGHTGPEITLNVIPKTVLDVTDKPFNVGYLKIRSGNRNAPRNQTEERTFTLVIVS